MCHRLLLLAPTFIVLELALDRPHRKTCRRFNEAGHAHALTFSCFRRQPFLNRDRTRQWFVDAVTAARDKHRFDLWAYVIMPEHVHLLVWPTEHEYDISEILLSIKQPVTRRSRAFVMKQAPEFLPRMTDEQPNGKSSVRFWQRGGGYDRNVTSAEVVHQTIEYLHLNPVRRGLCETPEDWKWSSAGAYTGNAEVPLSIDFESLREVEDTRRD